MIWALGTKKWCLSGKGVGIGMSFLMVHNKRNDKTINIYKSKDKISS